MKYTSIGIMLGRKCTAECKICCVSSSMEKCEKLDEEQLENFILSAKDIEAIDEIGFSGGEAFLYYETLIKSIKLSKKNGKKTSVITNGYWANTLENSVLKMQQLKEIGLDVIVISYDEYHSEYIPLQNVKNFLAAARMVNIKPVVQTIVINGADLSWMNELSECLSDTVVNILSCYPVGNAKLAFPIQKYPHHYTATNQYCRKSGVFSVSYDGKIWPCCSPYVYETSLSIGNIDSETIESALKKLSTNIILYALRNWGFDFFIEVAKKHLRIEVPEKIISSCQLCALFFDCKNTNKFIPYIHEKLGGVKCEKSK